MELSLGQYGAAGPITVWKCCPLLKGNALLCHALFRPVITHTRIQRHTANNYVSMAL